MEKELSSITKKHEELGDIYQNLLKEKASLVTRCDKDKQYLSSQITQLTTQLADALVLPDISPYIENLVLFDPWVEVFPIQDYVLADEEYYVYPKEDWVSMLRLVQPNVKAILSRWRKEISDCDNFALLMAGLVSGCFAKTEVNRQGAFMVAWSRTHAYNVYRDSAGVYWVYEPQNGVTVCKFEDAVDPYVSRKLWLMS